MDIFCQIKDKFTDQIIDQTKNFYLIHDGYPLAEGHLLIIPKKHIRSFLELDKERKKEFLLLRERVKKFMIKIYKKPVYFEHAGIFQTVPHAHFHILPTTESILEVILKLNTIIHKARKNYLYYSEGDKKYFLYPKSSLKPGFLHSTFAKELARPIFGPDRAKDLNQWLLKVKRNFKIWQKK